MEKIELMEDILMGNKMPEKCVYSPVKCGYVYGRMFIGDEELLELRGEYTCQICGGIGYDRRNIFISCLYDLSEVSKKLFYSKKDNGYYLRVCKGCRVAFMRMLGDFCNSKGRKEIKGLGEDGITGINFN